MKKIMEFRKKLESKIGVEYDQIGRISPKSIEKERIPRTVEILNTVENKPRKFNEALNAVFKERDQIILLNEIEGNVEFVLEELMQEYNKFFQTKM